MRALARCAWLGLLMCACATLPAPTQRDVDRARERWPDATLATLDEGWRLYRAHCGSCHALYSPKAHPPWVWAKAIPEMAARARIDPREQALILQFLTGASAISQTEATPNRG